MTSILAITAGLLIIGGLLGITHGLQRKIRPVGQRTESIQEWWTRVTRRPVGARGRRRDLIFLCSVIIGFVIAMMTGWLILILVLPVLVLGLPYLLILPQPRDIELLEALDRWVRSLAATL